MPFLRRRNTLVAALFFASALIACDRHDRELAGVKADKVVNPAYKSIAAESVTPGLSIVHEVLPQGEPVIDGAAIFAANCSACHQITGDGVPGAFPPLNKSPYVQSANTERLSAIVLYGLQGPIQVLGQTYNNVMAPLGAVLNDKQTAAVINHIRTSWDNASFQGTPVTPEEVAATRKKYGTRAAFSIAELGEEK